MKEKSAVLGQVVVSRAGRDSGRWYMVVELLDDQFVNVADGELRKLERPKKKKLRHLDVKPLVDQSVAHKLSANKRVMDAEIRSFLQGALGGADAIERSE